MNQKRLISQIVNLTLILLLSTGCNAAQLTPTLTPVLATATDGLTATATLPPSKIATLNPKPRAYISMAYDVESDRVILFGGQLGDYRLASNYNGETWAYDLTVNKWTEMKPSASPGNRSGHALAYDAESDRVILFGGGGWT